MKALEWLQLYTSIFKTLTGSQLLDRLCDLVEARIKKIHLKMNALKWVYGDLHVPNAQGQLCRILTNFKPIRYLMVALVSCKNKEDPIMMLQTKFDFGLSKDFRNLNSIVT